MHIARAVFCFAVRCGEAMDGRRSSKCGTQAKKEIHRTGKIMANIVVIALASLFHISCSIFPEDGRDR